MNKDQSSQSLQSNSFELHDHINRRDLVVGGSALLAATALAGTAPSAPGERASAGNPPPAGRRRPEFNTSHSARDPATPDTVETRIGTLKFFDGLPTKETSQKVYDNLDFMRAVEVFLKFIPAASIEAIRLGSAEHGVPGRTRF